MKISFLNYGTTAGHSGSSSGDNVAADAIAEMANGRIAKIFMRPNPSSIADIT
jgi:hypothetical protein